jgi:hypothetical protein
MAIPIERPGGCRLRTVSSLAIAAVLSCAPAAGKELDLAQLGHYSAGGTHQCGSGKGRSCVASGSGFSSCADATITLQTRDCCPTTPQGGTSSGFTLNYCIPEQDR